MARARAASPVSPGSARSSEARTDGLAAEEVSHEDAAVFTRLEQELRGLMALAETRLERGSAYGRRFALVRTKVEEAWLQARQGAHEAHYGQ